MAERAPGVATLEAAPPTAVTPGAPAAGGTGVAGRGQGRASLWSIGTALAGQGALLLSGPLVARSLGVVDRGHLAMVVLIPLLVTQVCQLGLPNAVTWALAGGNGKGHGALARPTVAAIAAQLAASAVLHAVAALAFTVGAPGPVRAVALASLPTTPAVLAHVYALAVLQGRRRFGPFNLLRTLPAVLYAATTLVLFVTGTGSLATITAAWSGSSALVAVVCIRVAATAHGPLPTGAAGAGPRELAGYALRGWLGSMSPLETFRLDQLVVGLVVSPSALGLYAVGSSFSNLPRFVAQSLGAIAFPAVAAETDEAAARRRVWRSALAGAAACGVVVAAIAAVAPVALPVLFGAEFRPAVGITQLLLVGALLTGVRRVLADGLRGLGRPGAGTVAEVATWVALLAALAVLVPTLGVRGAAIGFTVAAAAGLAVAVGGVARAGGR